MTPHLTVPFWATSGGVNGGLDINLRAKASPQAPVSVYSCTSLTWIHIVDKCFWRCSHEAIKLFLTERQPAVADRDNSIVSKIRKWNQTDFPSSRLLIWTHTCNHATDAAEALSVVKNIMSQLHTFTAEVVWWISKSFPSGGGSLSSFKCFPLFFSCCHGQLL